MADHTKPTVTTGYLDFVSQMHDKMNDISRGLDPARTSPTNMPQYAVRWSSASKKWQIWSGTAWNDLADEYAINVSGYATKLKTKRKISIGGGATAAGVDFDGTANIELDLTAIDYTKVSGLGSASTKTIGSSNGDVLEVGTGSGNSRTNSQNDSRFARLSGGDDANFTTAPKIGGVSLGSAATKNVGEGSGNVITQNEYGIRVRKPSKEIADLNATNGSPNAWNDWDNSSLFLENNNNALSVFISSKQNERNTYIQSGHNNSLYANAYGTISLNPFGGNVTVNGYSVYHAGNPPPASGVIWGNISGKPATATRWPTWGEVSGKPAIPPTNQSIGAGGVGQLAFVIHQGSTATGWGGTRAGSGLFPVSITRDMKTMFVLGSTLSGTWRILGARVGAASNNPEATLAIRIS